MTRKDYRLIADVLNGSTVTANLTDLAREDLALSFAKELHRASGFTPNGNKSFRADVFMLAACGEDLTQEAQEIIAAL